MIFWILLALWNPLQADSTIPKKDPRRFLYLYDAKTKDGLRVRSSLLPNRVYLRFDRKFNYWTFILTDSKGAFPEPLETLQAGTVLPSAFVGADDTYKSYALTADGHWIPSKLEQQLQVWIHSDPPLLATRLFAPTPAPSADPIGAVLAH